MGHYDNCRPGYCFVCGQAKGYCEHTVRDSHGTTVAEAVKEMRLNRKTCKRETVVDGPSALKLRPAVLWFAQEMERKLRANDHKGKAGWNAMPQGELLMRLYEEGEELRNVLGVPCASCGESSHYGRPSTTVINEAADVANFAMMIADNARRGH